MSKRNNERAAYVQPVVATILLSSEVALLAGSGGGVSAETGSISAGDLFNFGGSGAKEIEDSLDEFDGENDNFID